MEPRILRNWETMRTELAIAQDGHTFYVTLDHNAFLLKQAIMRKGLRNICIWIVREAV